MRQLRNRWTALALAAGVVVAAGCSETPPPPRTHQDGTDGGMARPRGEQKPAGKGEAGAGKKAPPRLDE